MSITREEIISEFKNLVGNTPTGSKEEAIMMNALGLIDDLMETSTHKSKSTRILIDRNDFAAMILDTIGNKDGALERLLSSTTFLSNETRNAVVFGMVCASLLSNNLDTYIIK